MTLVSGSIASLANGVSQQPSWVRLASQVETQENYLSSLVTGLTRRPGTRHLALLTTSLPATKPFIHIIDRDAASRYVVLISSGTIRVFDVNGTEKVVNFPFGGTYLAAANPELDFSAISVQDYTFITNRTVQVLPTSFASAGTRYGYVFIRQGAYSCNYRVYVNGSLVADHTTDTTVAATVQTSDIANNIATQLAANLGASWVVERLDSTIRISETSNADFTISARDGGGDTYSRAFRDSVQSFSDLPPRMWDGTWVEVVGSGSNQFDGYYVRFDEAAGSWRETVYPVDDFGPHPFTMPWQLVDNHDGTFTFTQGAWEKRKAGDVATAPDPSFVFRTISDIVFWKGRLGFISDDSVILSAAGEFFRFYPQTVTALLDNDPIDVSAGATRSTTIRAATPFQGSLLLWAADTQYELIADGGVPTPSSVSIEQPSAFPCATTARPVEAGKGVFFPFVRGQFSGVREYLTDRNTNTKDALDTTIHVPTYIPGNITRMAALRNDDLVLVASDADRSAVYAYKYHWEGDAKLQSSWSRWSLSGGGEVWAIGALGQKAILVVKRDEALFLETLEVDTTIGDVGLTWSVSLDRKSAVTGTYNAGTNQTTWALPFTGFGSVVVLGSGAGAYAGATPGGGSGSGTSYTAPGNWAGYPCIAGQPFTSQVTLSRITPEDKSAGAGKGRVALTDGRFQVLAVYPIVAKTGRLGASVATANGATRDYTLTPRTVGIIGSTLGGVPLADARWRVPIYARNDEIAITLKADTHLPCSVLSVDWEAIYTLRSQRM